MFLTYFAQTKRDSWFELECKDRKVHEHKKKKKTLPIEELTKLLQIESNGYFLSSFQADRSCSSSINCHLKRCYCCYPNRAVTKVSLFDMAQLSWQLCSWKTTKSIRHLRNLPAMLLTHLTRFRPETTSFFPCLRLTRQDLRQIPKMSSAHIENLSWCPEKWSAATGPQARDNSVASIRLPLIQHQLHPKFISFSFHNHTRRERDFIHSEKCEWEVGEFGEIWRSGGWMENKLKQRRASCDVSRVGK